MSINRNKVTKAAQKQIRKRNWDKALREYRKLVEDDPDDMRSLLKCGDLYVKLDRTAEALESYKGVADNYAQQDMYEKAIAVYKQALRLNPDEVVLHHAIAECYYRLGRLKDAVRSFHQVQSMYKERGEHDAQREILEHMVHIDPEDVGLRIQLAERYIKDGFADLALESFTYCSQRLDAEGRLDELLQVLERILYLTPERQDVRKQVVRLYLDRQDNKAALKHLQVCFRELPGDIETLEMLSQTFERLGRDQKAVMVLEELGPVYEKAGREADASNLYRRLLRLDPSNETARRATGADVANGPDSGVLAGPGDTGPMAQRQRTPPPVAEALDDVEFLDDDIEFLDDDLVGELAPAATAAPSRSANSPSPEASPATHQPAAAAPPPPMDDDEPLDLTDELEFIDDVDEFDEVIELDEFEPIEEVGVAGNISEAEVRDILGECDVFLKYGLYDKASVAISEALEEAPDSLYAHEKLLDLQQTTGDAEGHYSTLLKLAELTKETPLRAYDYLQQAREISVDPQGLQAHAQSLGIDLDAPPPTDGIDEISMSSIESFELIEEDESEVHELDPSDSIVEQLDDDEIEFLDADVDIIEEGFDDVSFDSLDGGDQGLAESTDLELDSGVAEVDIGDLDFGDDIDGAFGVPNDSEVVEEMDLEFGHADEIVDMEFDDGADIDDADLAALDESTDAENTNSGPGVNSLFADVEADDLFDDLFGDMSDGSAVNLGGDDPRGEMAEIDFFLQQGLTEEASEALNIFAEENPHHPGIGKRRNQLREVRSGLEADDNPVGARSLSQKFNPRSLEQDSGGEVTNFDSVVNSNLELGVAYRDMGLLSEAIEEFRQATDDPEAAISAYYNIGLCEMDLGETAAAKNTFGELLQMDAVTSSVRHKVRQRIDELEAQAS